MPGAAVEGIKFLDGSVKHEFSAVTGIKEDVTEIILNLKTLAIKTKVIEKDYEKESAEVSKNSVVAIDGMATLRPSVEVGFHAILKKYVIHTHSVYANIITCSMEGEALAEKLFKDSIIFLAASLIILFLILFLV